MTDTFLSVETEGLQEAIDNATSVDWAVLTDALGEGITRFKDRLRGDNVRPGNPWPIGTRKLVNGVKAHYVPLGTENSERSGRSLRGWKSRQRGISAVVFNDARDKIGGTFYAQHVHLKNKESGSAAEEAFEIFSEEMEQAAQEMIASLTEQISGD